MNDMIVIMDKDLFNKRLGIYRRLHYSFGYYSLIDIRVSKWWESGSLCPDSFSWEKGKSPTAFALLLPVRISASSKEACGGQWALWFPHTHTHLSHTNVKDESHFPSISLSGARRSLLVYIQTHVTFRWCELRWPWVYLSLSPGSLHVGVKGLWLNDENDPWEPLTYLSHIWAWMIKRQTVSQSDNNLYCM